MPRRITVARTNGHGTGESHDAAEQATRYWASSRGRPGSARARNLGDIANEVRNPTCGAFRSHVFASTLDIDVEVPAGIPDSVRSLVEENSLQLKFKDHGFE